MAYDRSYLYLRIIGHFGTATEFADKWSTGFKLASPIKAEPLISGFDTFLNSVQAAISVFHSHALTRAGRNVWLDELTVARLGTDGRYDPITQETTRYSYAASVAGQGVPVAPFNSSMVGSLRTARPRGYASNGRFYYPMLAPNLEENTGRMTAGTITAWLQNAKTMLNAINTAGQAMATPVVVHVMSQWGAGLSSAVFSVRADGRMDSIERRENALPSVYQEVPL